MSDDPPHAESSLLHRPLPSPTSRRNASPSRRPLAYEPAPRATPLLATPVPGPARSVIPAGKRADGDRASPGRRGKPDENARNHRPDRVGPQNPPPRDLRHPHFPPPHRSPKPRPHSQEIRPRSPTAPLTVPPPRGCSLGGSDFPSRDISPARNPVSRGARRGWASGGRRARQWLVYPGVGEGRRAGGRRRKSGFWREMPLFWYVRPLTETRGLR